MEANVIGQLVEPDETSEPLGFDVAGDTAVVAMLRRSSLTLSGIEIVGGKEEKPCAVVVLGAGPDCTVRLPLAVPGHDDERGYDHVVDIGQHLVVRRHELQRLDLADERELWTLQPKAVLGRLHA